MTQARKEFLIWWVTMIVLVVGLWAAGAYVYWDEIHPGSIATGIAILVLVFGPGVLPLSER